MQKCFKTKNNQKTIKNNQGKIAEMPENTGVVAI